MKRSIKIGQYEIGENHPVFIIAEAGVNHNGNPELAKQLVKGAFEAGATAVKFQTFSTERLLVKQSRKLEYQKQSPNDTESQWEMLKRLELSKETFHELKKYADSLGIVFLSTPFDNDAVDLLDSLGVGAFKVSSADLTNFPLITYVAHKGKPILLSTGMATLGEVEQALEVIRKHGDPDIVLLHCTSLYPCPAKDCNLKFIETMRAAFGVPVGYSDHTKGWEIPIASVPFKIAVIEKHFTIDRESPGPDHKASLEPKEFACMVKEIRKVEEALGNGIKHISPQEEAVKRHVRRRIIAGMKIPQGTIISPSMLVYKRADEGLEINYAESVIGRTAKILIEEGSPITPSILL